MAKIFQKKEKYPRWFTVAPDIWGMKDIFVNIFMIYNRVENKWVLIDTGIPSTAKKIRVMAEYLFGSEVSTPSAIVLTHGHFDHIGSLIELVREWQIPIYAHHLEAPYLTGKSSYPPPDPFAGGGIMTLMSWLFPKGPINVSGFLRPLPDDGSVPGLPEWKNIHTPGHAPGHISLFRPKDKVLISGDAIVTTKQESAISVMQQRKVLSGPPRYFTPDWQSAQESVKSLIALEPTVLAAGHGIPMKGMMLKQSLDYLLRNFRKIAVPKEGRYVDSPAKMNDKGVQYIPPFKITKTVAESLIAVGAGISLGILLTLMDKRKN
ncbi:MAG: MBL fold metallo-hydrolase [Chitinophagales bacterium]|nr:MBL fold metallo-hydrolase [Chitinophagales bacterium]